MTVRYSKMETLVLLLTVSLSSGIPFFVSAAPASEGEGTIPGNLWIPNVRYVDF